MGNEHAIGRRALMGAAAALAALPAAAQAPWPQRPLRLLVGAGPGGTTDILARLIAPQMHAILGQPVVVENRAGAGSVVAAEVLARARPDGELAMLINNAHAVAAATLRRLPYDPVEDFAPATLVATMPLVFLVSRDSPIRDFAQMMAEARARPGALNYASVGAATTQNFVAEALQASAGIGMTHVPYRTTPAAMVALRNGEVQVVVETVGAVVGQIREGEVRALALSTGTRFEGLPDVPAVAEAGGPAGFDLATWYALAFPARTPPEILDRARAAVVQVLADPQIRRQFLDLGLTAVGSPPEAARSQIVREIARSREIVARAGIPVQ